MSDIEEGRLASQRADARATLSAGHEAVSAEVDLTGIDPLHWADTRERVAILRAWCANGRHPRSEALAAAARMGVTVSHFYRLVSAWKKHRDARLVSGHNGRRGDTRDQHGARPVADDARAIMDRVIGRRGTEARFTDLRAEVRSECAADGIAPPSSGLVHKAMMRARQAQSGAAAGPVDDVAVAVVECLLPVMAGDGTVATPELVLAVERPGGVIVGHRLVIDGDVVAAARPLVAQTAAEHHRRVTVVATLAGAVAHDGCDSDEDAATTDAPCAGARDARIQVVRRSTLLSTTLGSYIDSIPIRHRSHAARKAGPWRPLSPDDAVTAVDLAVAAHNAARRG